MLARAWVLCAPSVYEGFGVPALEAFAYGVPVVATPNPGIRHLSPNGYGAILSSDAEFGDHLIGLLLDADARDRIGRQGRRRAADFAWAAVIRHHEQAYEEAIAKWESQEKSNPWVRSRSKAH
jgi:glycosyltransferase involved in cell wall biosynthesis